MHWIEDILEISPDGGSGQVELLIAMALALLAITVIAVSMPRSRGGRDRSGIADLVGNNDGLQIAVTRD